MNIARIALLLLLPVVLLLSGCQHFEKSARKRKIGSEGYLIDYAADRRGTILSTKTTTTVGADGAKTSV